MLISVCQDVNPIMFCLFKFTFFAHQFFYLLKILTLQIPAFIKLGSKVVEFSIPDSSYLTVKDPDPGVLANPQL